MPLKRDNIIAKFLEVVPLTQYPTCYHAGYEALTVKFQKANAGDLLDSITLSFPPLEGEHAARYALIISLFWVCVLPPGTPPADYITKAVEKFKKTGHYEETFGDVRVSLTGLGSEFFLRACAA